MNVGAPLVDILYGLTLIAGLLGIREKNAGLIIFSILIGPFSKESYIFFAPVVFFFSHLPKWKLFLWFMLSGILVFSSRYIIDQATGYSMTTSIAADINVINAIPFNINRLRIMGYWNEIGATFGLWLLVPPLTRLYLKRRPGNKSVFREGYVIAFLVSTAWQILLNGEYARMMYMLMPVWAIVIAKAIEQWRTRLLLHAPRGIPESPDTV
jgi:hypothetical protein